MKKFMKRFLAFGLGCALMVTAVPMATKKASAKTIAVKNYTLYMGETLSMTASYGFSSLKISSVKNSKKSVANVKIISGKKAAKITPKKPGKTVVRMKTKKGTYKANITIKKLALKYSFKQLAGGNILVTLKNNTKQTFSSVSMDVTLKGSEGETLGYKHSITFWNVAAKKEAYEQIYNSSSEYIPALSKTKVKVTGFNRSLSAKYYDYSSKVKTTVSKKRFTSSYDDGGYTLTTKTKNKANAQVNAMNYLFLYNSQNQLLGVMDESIYVSPKTSKKGYEQKVYLSSYPGFDHVKVKTVAIYTKY